MPICPHCQREASEPLAPCPSDHDYYCIDEEEYYAHKTDTFLGRRIAGRYIVQSVLGRGSMARVYEAHQDQVDRTVALKIFRPETILGRKRGTHTTDDERERAKQQFVREAKVLGQLSHPNCVTVYDFGAGQEGSFLHIAMEFVAGDDLRAAINRGLKLDAIVEIGRQLLGALREAHSLEIVHRDLKPENVVLSYRPSRGGHVVKVLDFGIAKLLAETDHGGEGQLFGTPAYMSPEQCRGEAGTVGPPADVYAFGCMFYEMICGRLPYPADSAREMVEAHKTAELPPLEPRPGLDVPEAFETMVRTCLQKAPADRYRTGGEALSALEEAVAHTDVSLGISTAVSPETGSEVGPNRDVVVPDNCVSGATLDPVGDSSDDSDDAPEPGGFESVPETQLVAIDQEAPPPESHAPDRREPRGGREPDSGPPNVRETPQLDTSSSDSKSTVQMAGSDAVNETIVREDFTSDDHSESDVSMLEQLGPRTMAAVGTVFVVAISVVVLFYVIVTSM
jgi:serine/threonine protein kinase